MAEAFDQTQTTRWRHMEWIIIRWVPWHIHTAGPRPPDGGNWSGVPSGRYHDVDIQLDPGNPMEASGVEYHQVGTMAQTYSWTHAT